MIVNELKQQVYDAAQNGMALLTVSTIIKCPSRYKHALLNGPFALPDDQQFTPLITAARYGHDNVVRCLLSQFAAIELDAQGVVKADDKLIEGVTALFCAAAFGHLTIVKMLVKAGANVNHCSKTKSTPLRAACYDNRLDIAMFLVCHGADISIANDFDNTVLMAAAAKGYINMVAFLLNNNADVNAQSFRGSTALHFAAEHRFHNIIELLVRNGAKFVRNSFNLTPLLVAAERTYDDTVRFILDLCPIFSRDEIIEAYELLGASFANDNTNYNLLTAYLHLSHAMNLRYDNDTNLVLKKTNLLPPISDYLNHKESETLDDLERLSIDDNRLHMEGLVIRERILGADNSMLTTALIFRGAVFADVLQFDNCINLWIRAMRIKVVNDEPVYRDILRFAQLFSQMISHDFIFTFEQYNAIFSSTSFELELSKNRYNHCDGISERKSFRIEMEFNLMSSLYLINILTKISNNFTPSQMVHLETVVFNIVKLDVRLRDGQSLLHLAVSKTTPVDDFHTNDVCKFPCAETTKLLLKCGANVNSMTVSRCTPLHHLVGLESFRDAETLQKIMLGLIKAGAHVDAVNKDGKSPIDDPVLAMLMQVQFHMIVNLKCLAARTIVCKRIKYHGFVPESLEAFIELHGDINRPRH